MNEIEELLKTLARCRIIPKDTALEKFEPSTIQVCLDKKWMTRNEKYYFLTEEGEKYIKENIKEINRIYRSFIDEKDEKLVDFYLDLSENEKKTWKTKDDWLAKYQQHRAVVDGSYINKEGKLMGVKLLKTTDSFDLIETVEMFLRDMKFDNIYYMMYRKKQ